MIRVECQECNNELTLVNVQHFGISDCTLKLAPCQTCIDAAEANYGDEFLQERVDLLEDEVISLENENESLEENISFLWEESRELKWKERCKTAEAEVQEIQQNMDQIKIECNEDLDEAEEKVKTFASITKKAESISRQIKDECEVDTADLKLRIKKLSLQVNKLTAKTNGGKYERKIDI